MAGEVALALALIIVAVGGRDAHAAVLTWVGRAHVDHLFTAAGLPAVIVTYARRAWGSVTRLSLWADGWSVLSSPV